MKARLLFTLLLSLGMFFPLLAQERTVTGKVTGATDGMPLPGVNVVLKGTTSGTVTDADGKYSLRVAGSDAVLVFKFVGYLEKEVSVGALQVIDVALEDDVKQLEEVVVTGYGQQLKTELTGNIAKVAAKELQNVPVAGFQSAIQGRAAGVFVNAGNGKLGQGISMRIRGTSSLTASSDPLYVIDGMVVTSQSASDPGSARTNPLADMNFNDIESIEILKDASAAAIYGARAANGVVIITTKRGRQAKTSFNIGVQTGFSKPTNYREFLNSQEYIQLYTDAANNADDDDGYDYDDPDSYTSYITAFFDRTSGHTDWTTGGGNTNWEKQAFQDAPFRQIDFSANGGNDKTMFFASGSLSDQAGILVGNNFSRFSGRVNIDHKASEKLRLGVSSSLSRTENKRIADDNEFSTIMQIVALAPLSPVRDPNGVLYSDRSPAVTTYYNPLVEYENSRYVQTSFRNLSNFYLNYEIVKGLKLQTEWGIDLYMLNEDRYRGRKTEASSTNGYGISRWTQIGNYNTSTYLTYDKSAGAHNLNLVGGIAYQYGRTDVTRAEGQQFPPIFELQKLTSAATPVVAFSDMSEFSYLSYFSRANYKMSDKYLVTLSARVDGSSRFGTNNRYGFFPAASLGWILSEESFLKNNKVISFLKARASYGLTGNSEIDNYAARGKYLVGNYGGGSTLAPNSIANPDLTWEKTAQMDFGFDFGLFNDRISGEIDYYVKNTTDLLLNVPIPSTSGYTVQYRNIGEMQNKGIELVINTSNLTGKFKWNTSFNFARNRNKIIDMEGQIIQSTSSRYLNQARAGQPIGVFYGVEYAGVDPNTGNALYYKNTVNADGTIDRSTTTSFSAASRTFVGDPNPDFIGGVTNTFSYKGFELSVLVQFVKGNDIYNAGGGFMSANGLYEDNQTRDQMNYWKQPGDITNVPRPVLYTQNGTRPSSRYITDGSYTRVKNVMLSYNLPAAIASKVKLSSARIYMSAQNLFTFTKYNGWDPEVSTDFLTTDNQGANVYQGVDFYAAPQPKTITFGLNLGF
jgi:TonB-linked SusC/RagA family outer membrane protein